MKYLDYYFTKCYQWNNGWFSKEGQIRPIIRPSQEVISKHGWIDYAIFESVFIYNSKMLKIDFVDKIIMDIKNTVNDQKSLTSIFNEIVGLEVKKDFSRLIDNIGDSEGIEAPLSWNISTPEHLQYIPTTEVLNLMKDWYNFLIEVESMTFTKK